VSSACFFLCYSRDDWTLGAKVSEALSGSRWSAPRTNDLGPGGTSFHGDSWVPVITRIAADALPFLGARVFGPAT
jgi:hypothetical protein